MTTVLWTPGLALRCPACAWSCAPGPVWDGCGACGGPLEPSYPAGAAERLPIPAALLTDLGRRPTPLLRLPGDGRTWLKLESANPTGSHKDRFHAITSALARLSGAAGVVTTSTGNHGVSCAAHAALDGLPCVVLATGPFTPGLSAQLAAYGALVATLGHGGRASVLRTLVDAGWTPATSSDPALTGAGNPFGADGYRAVADEIASALGALPDLVCVPAASGDTLAGVARGFAALAEANGRGRPVVASCQPAGAAPLAASLAAGRAVTVEQPRSIARSTADPRSGRLALAAVERSGAALTVPEERIVQATRRLAARGIYVETSSALALAGVEVARETGLVAADALAVAVLTATGRGWSEREPGLFRPPHAALADAESVVVAAGRLTAPSPSA